MLTCVYQIINLRTFKFYIGSAKSFENRYKRIDNDWTKHHNSDLMYDAKNNDNFLYCIIQECASYAEALCMEQWWLDFYVINGLWKCLYNKNKCVWKWEYRDTGPKSIETRNKISTSVKLYIANNPNRKKGGALKGNKCSLGRIPWNKGLTKATDIRVANIGVKRANFFKNNKSKK